ncbi:MAG: GTPase HflX [Candidatus Aminicenantes bacterium]|nr:GTPase HflX [Candidatus Aminicenantes bacterium]NIM77959.1 GTPase HflX [Candidatus Aminicenantes bacterium]NIN17288.1 GTPase HflX [Candidatus Aminicenantes bacterium]NIN41179.1 GTPase HflX [Candidatus Aminicenantes bacterium]NIN83956.1 GTPase HflX [Candidatus Aminicenantes bacterium]
MNNKYFRTSPGQERAALVGLVLNQNKKADTETHLEELAFLAETAGAKPVTNFIQRLFKPNPSTFVGSGMLEKIKNYVQENGVDTVIFDDELSPSQLRNIERELNRKVLDRTNLILDIFASRARTAHARIQVELAQYEYLLPRLAGRWPHLERQRGGIGLRGPGEAEIETDRRVIRDKIARLKKQLIRIDRQKSTQRMHRGKLVRVALVGYTNAGKSTLLNLLSKSSVLTENKLFATLDTTVRRVVVKNLPFLLADTVGFIHKLPHCLVESFKATLDEVREADLLLHVIDVSHPNFEEQIAVVHATLKEIGAKNKPLFTVFNKVDILTERSAYHVIASTPRNPGSEGNTSLYVSATEKINIDILREKLYEQVKEIHITRYPYNDFLYNLDDCNS